MYVLSHKRSTSKQMLSDGNCPMAIARWRLPDGNCPYGDCPMATARWRLPFVFQLAMLLWIHHAACCHQ
jgi:hypothetical protein